MEKMSVKFYFLRAFLQELHSIFFSGNSSKSSSWIFSENLFWDLPRVFLEFPESRENEFPELFLETLWNGFLQVF